MIIGKKQGRKKVQFIFFIVFIVALIGVKLWQYHWPQEQLILDGQEITVLVAQTPWHWHRGLGKRENMEGFDAMVFVFPFSERHGIVMRDMHFPIDIVWIERGVVVDIAPNVAPEPGVAEEDLRIYLPRVEANMVVELPAGWAQEHDLQIGDYIEAPRS